MPNWFDGLPIDSGLRYSAVADERTVVVLSPKMPPKMFLTWLATVTLYWYGCVPGPAQIVSVPDSGHVALAAMGTIALVA